MTKISSYGNNSSQPVVGEIVFSEGGTPPGGFLKCDGSILSQSTYPDLYTKVGLIQNNFEFTSVAGIVGTLTNPLAYGNGIFTIAGNAGALSTSTDAITWTSRTSGTTSSIFTLKYANNLYLYGGAGGVLATSTDAITWTPRTSGTTQSIIKIDYINNLYIYGGVGGVLATSTDAITWTSRTSGTTATITTFCYGNGLYLYGGGPLPGSTILATSTDAITWTIRNVTTLAGTTISGLVYGDSKYILTSNITNTPMSFSYDGINWYNLSVNNSAAGGLETLNVAGFKGITYDGNNFIAAANFGIGVSRDGLNWRLLRSSIVTDTKFSAEIAYGNSKYVMSGRSSSGEVLYCYPYSYNISTEFALPYIAGEFYIKI